MDNDLVAELSQANFLPREALQRAVAAPDAITEPVLQAVALAAQDPDAPSDEQINLLFWGVHALAAARDTRVFAPLLDLLRHDGEVLEGIFGDAVTETLPLVLSSTFDGDADALHRLLLDTTLDETVRNSAFVTLAYLTREGRLERDATRALLERFDEARIATEASLGWIGWEEAIAYLGLAELAPRAEAARKDGRITEEFGDLDWFREALRETTAKPPRYDSFGTAQYGTLDDPVAALGWTAEGYGQPVRNPFKDVGRNDPCPCGSGKKYKKCCLAA